MQPAASSVRSAPHPDNSRAWLVRDNTAVPQGKLATVQPAGAVEDESIVLWNLLNDTDERRRVPGRRVDARKALFTAFINLMDPARAVARDPK